MYENYVGCFKAKGETMSPLEECCPGCERKGYVYSVNRAMMFKINGNWEWVYYSAYRCSNCEIEFITDDDPFQKAKDLGWVKG